MDVPSQSGGCTTKHQNHLFRWFLCFWHPVRFERARSTKMPGAFLDSFSWPAKQANPRDGVSTPAAAPQNIKTTLLGGFCVFGTLSNLNAPVRPPVCRVQTGTAPLAR